MNANEQFDELARRKLEERAIPFEESAWLDAEKAILANKRKRKGLLPYAAGTAVLIALWLLWPTAQEEVAQQAGSKQVEIVPAIEQPTPVSQPAEPVATTAATTRNTTAQVTERRNAEVPTALEKSAARNVGSINVERRAIEKPVVAEVERTAVVLEPLSEEAHVEEAVVVAVESSTQPEVVDAVAPTELPSAPIAEEPTVIVPALVIEQPVVLIEEPVTSAPEIALAAANEVGSANASAVEPNAEPVSEPLPADESRIGEGAVPAVVVAGMEPSTSAPQDSLMVTPVPTAAAPPVVPANAPWEISLLGGLFSTTSQYAGGESAAWSVDRERTAGFGAEFMRMGRHVGVGLGVQYTSYADRLHTPQANSTTITYDPFWYLQAVDTTILIITGSFLDSLGNVVYTGQNVNTTVQVLRSSVDTISTTTLLREARVRVNRTSYIEVPLLFDAHVVQGRWSFGLRAGPSIGMLTSRQVSLPNEADTTGGGLGDMVLREYVWGCTARGYVRYRFNSAWSIGLEPAIRGQLQNGLDKQLFTRRSSAYGCMLSLSYRLP